MKTVLIAGAALALAMPAFAQTQPARQTSSPTAKSATMTNAGADQTFVKKAAEGGMAEVELGKLAQDKATNDQVKQFAKKMVDDHGKANDELKSIAQKKNITLPSDLNSKDKALKSRLEKLSGPAFDRAYMQAMLKDHRTDVNEFRTESKSGKDSEVKEWASKTLPTLEDHLKLAQDDERAVGTSGTSKTTKKSTKSTGK
jgi:putative membrane protein